MRSQCNAPQIYFDVTCGTLVHSPREDCKQAYTNNTRNDTSPGASSCRPLAWSVGGGGVARVAPISHVSKCCRQRSLLPPPYPCNPPLPTKPLTLLRPPLAPLTGQHKAREPTETLRATHLISQSFCFFHNCIDSNISHPTFKTQLIGQILLDVKMYDT